MKVKIGNEIYDSSKEPIMLILTDIDKDLISRMHPKAFKYCAFPDTWQENEIKKWMAVYDE